MMESPVLQRFADRQERKGMVRAVTKGLEGRFGPIPSDLAILLEAIDDQATLDRLAMSASQCPDLDAFRAGLPG